METVEITFDGVAGLEVPVMPSGKPLPLPFDSFEEFPTYCGPGRLGDKLVPDKIYAVAMNVACYIHDVTEAMARNREEDHQSNEILRDNMFTILRHHEPKPAWKDNNHHKRWYRVITYYVAVDTLGLRDDTTGEPE